LEQLPRDSGAGSQTGISDDRVAVAGLWGRKGSGGGGVSPVCWRREEGKDKKSPWQQLTNQIYLGTEAFVQGVQGHIPCERSLQDIPEPQRRAPAKPLQFYAEQYTDRREAMAEAYRSGAYSMREIGNYFGVSRMTVSRAVRRFGEAKATGGGKDLTQSPSQSPCLGHADMGNVQCAT